MADLTVVGIGNALAGDDGVGSAIAAALAERELPAGAAVRQAAGDPLAVVEELAAGRAVLLLDACRFGGAPGATTWLRLDDPVWPLHAAPLSLHGLDLPAAFRLARALGLPLERAWLMGVEPAAGALEGQGLSPALSAALPGLVEDARRGAVRMRDGLDPNDRCAAPPAAAAAAT
jgi:hydrogenase maturation protease